MSAKEMFEKLGYIYKKCNSFIEYTKNYLGQEKCITFWLDIKKIDFEFEHDDGYDWKYLAFESTIEELQAINQQVEELGWNER